METTSSINYDHVNTFVTLCESPVDVQQLIDTVETLSGISAAQLQAAADAAQEAANDPGTLVFSSTSLFSSAVSQCYVQEMSIVSLYYKTMNNLDYD